MPLWCLWGSLPSSGRNILMRVLPIIVIITSAVLSHAAYAKVKTAAETTLKRPVAQTYSAEESSAAGAAARRKADEQQRTWDKKTKSITRGICTGC
jgi:hypothetical protein